MKSVRTFLKGLCLKVSPAYRSIRRLEARTEELYRQLDRRFDKLEDVFWYAHSAPDIPLSQTKRAFFQALPAAEGTLRDIQQGNCLLLRRFRHICEENNIPYWISFGTLLGAARHGGFIPWDDDVDVSLLREGFEKIREVLSRDEAFALRSYYDQEGRYYLYKMVPAGYDHPSFWIDITIWDCVDTKPLGKEEVWRRITRIREKTFREFGTIEKGFQTRYHSDPLSPDDGRKLQAAVDRNRNLLPEPRKPDCLYRSLDSVYLGGETLLELSEVFPLCRLTFEGEEYPAPCGYERYLTEVYRYLEFPPSFSPGHMAADQAEEKIARELDWIRSVDRPMGTGNENSV